MLMNKLFEYIQYPFVQYALIVGLLVSLCASLLGVTLVLKRYSFIGDSLSHAAFCIMTVGVALNLSNRMYITLPGTVLVTIIVLNRRNTKINDAFLALISVSTLALGYFLMNICPPSGNVSADVCTTLFGSTSILTLSMDTVILCIGLSLLTIVVFLLLYPKIMAITFDETFAQSSGIAVRRINVIFSIIIGVIIVLAMTLVGSLLITALVVFPALTSMKLFGDFKRVTLFSVIISLGCTLIGLLVSILIGTPVGATIVIIDMLVYFIISVLNKIIRR